MPRNKKTFVLTLITSLSVLPILGMISDGAYFRYAFSRAIPGLEDTEKIKDAVTEFNNRLMDIYASEANKNAVYMIPATAPMRHRLVKDAGFLGMGGSVLVWDIASLDIKSVKTEGPTTATAIVDEEWNYQYKKDKNFQGITDVHGTGGRYRYFLVKSRGRWLVQKYEPVREAKKHA